MPEISRFFGIVVAMLWRDHRPPHFHAFYADHEAAVEIETGTVTGYLPTRALKLVQEWRQLHKVELLEDWRAAEARRTLKRIAPLE
ncbi:MAG: DUF4160 domain-containing protein [bacterium]